MNGQSRDKGNIGNKTKKKTKTFVKNINKRKHDGPISFYIEKLYHLDYQ
jgi:hypothetical protein